MAGGKQTFRGDKHPNLPSFVNRACPGCPIAFDVMWITIATILSVHNISKAVDKNGKAIVPDPTYDSGLFWSVFFQLLFKVSV